MRNTLAALGALIVVIIIIVAVGSGGSKTNGNSPAAEPSTSAPATKAPAAEPSMPAPSTKAPATEAPAMSVSQQQAVQAAQSYLDLGTGFSYKSLLEQLTSSAGEGFPKADAEFAIKHINPDWNAQAVIAAKNYLELGGFSRASLIEQLTSDAGDGFTQAQAEQAVKAVDL